MQPQSTGNGGPDIIEIDTLHRIHSLFFAEDGEKVFSSADEEILRQWQVTDGKEVGQAIRTTRAEIHAAVLSPDRKWLVCGLKDSGPHGAHWKFIVRVWNVQTNETALDVKGNHYSISSIDISPDSTKIATVDGSHASSPAYVWSISTGERLLGPLQHNNMAVAVRFSPTGDRIAIATCQDSYATSIHIYNSENGAQMTVIPFPAHTRARSSVVRLAWSADGHQLFAASDYQIMVKDFDITSNSLLARSERPVGGDVTSITLSHNQRFIVVSSYTSLLFLNTSTHERIGTAIQHASQIVSAALSPNDECVATGEQSGKISFRSLCDVLPPLFLAVNLPLLDIRDAVFKTWMKNDLSRTEELLAGELIHSADPHYHSCTLANAALVRARLGQHNLAIDDAKKSIKIRNSVAGHIAHAMARVGNGEHDSALRAFDLVFNDDLTAERNLLLLIKAIILFECEKRDDAIARVGDLIDTAGTHSLYITVRAYMLFLLAGMSLGQGDTQRATELLQQAREAIPVQKDPRLVTISLIFGWDFDKLAHAIQLHLQECIRPVEADGDAAMQSNDPERAILRYSTALTLDPLNPAGLLVKRSKAQAALGSWEDALRDADEAIKTDPSSPWGHERRHAALHALQRYDEAVGAFTRMFALIEESSDQDIRQLATRYISPSQLETTIESVVRGVFKICPPILIDVENGHLCDGPTRLNTFKSESKFKELVSSMTEKLDNTRIVQVVAKYFQYVMFSHVLEEKEPSFQDVNSVTSVWNLDSSPLNDKLKKFCEVVRTDGHRWAWSGTCCVDRTISTVFSQSLTMAYQWYEASAATFVFLASLPSPSAAGDLAGSVWMKLAWTLQVALAPRVIRFYDRDWKPYLGDTRANHKESPEIIQELADAIGIAREIIVAFNPDDLSVREKLRLTSARNEVVEEDLAYALIGIFKSDIRPHYGEGDAALGHLLEEIVARSGEVTVLSWTGKSSSYHSCLPDTLAVYRQPPHTFSTVEAAEMDERVAVLRNSLSQTDAMLIYDRTTRLPPVRFANRRLHLPCVVFAVKKLNVQDAGVGQENRYRARVSGIGQVEFQTSDTLLTEPFKLILAHPWIRDLRDSFDAFTWDSTADSDQEEEEEEADSESESEGSEFESAPSSPLHASTVMDDYTLALRLVVRLQQPFHALLFQQQRNGQFKRVAAEHEIVVPGIDRTINFGKDIRTQVVEVL